MKKAITIAAFILLVALAFWLGTRVPNRKVPLLEKEVAALKEIREIQEQQIDTLTLVNQRQSDGLDSIVFGFNQLREDLSGWMSKLDKSNRRGREFEKRFEEKMLLLEKRRKDLMEEAKKFDL